MDNPTNVTVNVTPVGIWKLLKKHNKLCLEIPARDYKRFRRAISQAKNREVRYLTCVGIYRYSDLEYTVLETNGLYLKVSVKLIDWFAVDESLEKKYR